jgi:hypothetical protein
VLVTVDMEKEERDPVRLLGVAGKAHDFSG